VTYTANLTSISDLAEAYPNGEFAHKFREDWVMGLIKETKSNRDFQPRTIETARWARELVKRQIGGQAGTMQQT
jgi:importin subunit beta-1